MATLVSGVARVSPALVGPGPLGLEQGLVLLGGAESPREVRGCV